MKKYKDDKSGASKFKNLRRRGKPVSKTRQDEQCQCGARFGVVKTRIFFKFIDIFPFPGHSCCPVKALLSHLQAQKKLGWGRIQDPVFTYPSGKFLTPSGLNAIFKSLLGDICDFERNYISCHSLRAGIPSALFCFPDLLSSDDVKGWGRWSSEAYQRYTRLKIDQKREIFMKISSALSQS